MRSWCDRQLASWKPSPVVSSYSLVRSTSFTSGLQQGSGSESDQDHDSLLDGVLCETCMDIVILMSQTVLGAADRAHTEKTQDHTAVGLAGCGQSSSVPNFTYVVEDWTKREDLVDGSRVETMSNEKLISKEDKVDASVEESQTIEDDTLKTSKDQSGYHDHMLIVLWLSSVECCMPVPVVVA